MFPKPAAEIRAAVNPFTAGDVAAILRERGWLRHEGGAVANWLAEAAALLGPQAEDREELAGLLDGCALAQHESGGLVRRDLRLRKARATDRHSCKEIRIQISHSVLLHSSANA